MYCNILGEKVDGTAMQASDFHPEFEISALSRKRYGITRAELRHKYPDHSLAGWRMLYQIFDAPVERSGYTTIETQKRGTPAICAWSTTT